MIEETQIYRQRLKLLGREIMPKIVMLMEKPFGGSNLWEGVYAPYFHVATWELLDVVATGHKKLKDLPSLLRLNDQLYYLNFQVPKRLCETLELLIDDMVAYTKDQEHPFYCYVWRYMLKLLENNFKDKEGRLTNETFEKVKSGIKLLEQRAKEHGLLENEI